MWLKMIQCCLQSLETKKNSPLRKDLQKHATKVISETKMPGQLAFSAIFMS